MQGVICPVIRLSEELSVFILGHFIPQNGQYLPLLCPLQGNLATARRPQIRPPCARWLVYSHWPRGFQMERRRAILYLGAGVLAGGVLGCDSESKPAATVTVFNNEKVHEAVGTLDGITGNLETDSENSEGGTNWRDVVSEVKEHIEQLRSALDDLPTALGYS
jgi:hypothetical protein